MCAFSELRLTVFPHSTLRKVYPPIPPLHPPTSLPSLSMKHKRITNFFFCWRWALCVSAEPHIFFLSFFLLLWFNSKQTLTFTHIQKLEHLKKFLLMDFLCRKSFPLLFLFSYVCTLHKTYNITHISYHLSGFLANSIRLNRRNREETIYNKGWWYFCGDENSSHLYSFLLVILEIEFEWVDIRERWRVR